MNVLVTGAAGCVGLAACKELTARGHAVTGLDNLSRLRLFGIKDLADYAMAGNRVSRACQNFIARDFRHLYEARDPDDIIGVLDPLDVIVHCAAQTSHPRSIDTPIADFEINAVGTFLFLEQIRAMSKPPAFIYISTSKVYGGRVDDWHRVPVSESCPLGDGTELTPFGISKLAADLYTQEYARLYGLRTLVLRPNCITGGEGTQAVEQQNWLPRIARCCRQGEVYTIYGHDGWQIRDVLHADDMARAIAEVIRVETDCDWRGEVYNIGGGYRLSISLRGAIEEIERRTGKKLEVRLGPRRHGDWLSYVTDYSKFRERFGWTPQVTLGQILDEVCLCR